MTLTCKATCFCLHDINMSSSTKPLLMLRSFIEGNALLHCGGKASVCTSDHLYYSLFTNLQHLLFLHDAGRHSLRHLLADPPAD